MEPHVALAMRVARSLVHADSLSTAAISQGLICASADGPSAPREFRDQNLARHQELFPSAEDYLLRGTEARAYLSSN